MNSADYPFSNYSPCFAVLEIKKSKKQKICILKELSELTPLVRASLQFWRHRSGPWLTESVSTSISWRFVSQWDYHLFFFFFPYFFQAYIIISNLKKVNKCSEVDGRSREVIPVRKQRSWQAWVSKVCSTLCASSLSDYLQEGQVRICLCFSLLFSTERAEPPFSVLLRLS